MKKLLLAMSIALYVLCFAAANQSRGETYPDEAAGTVDEAPPPFSPEELDDLLAPIALYPDPLLAQMLPAATFINEIDEAARYVRRYGAGARLDQQPWDVSVRAVAHYPDILFMMDRKYDWTVSLGQAFLTQQEDVMDAIQRLRADAEAAGTLASTPQQDVISQDGSIRIIPAEPEVVYVPQYDPTTVYVPGAYPAYGGITFGIGFTIGAWLNRDCDWHRHHIYYHGWRGDGWIRRSRPYINRYNSPYISNRYRDIRVNTRVTQHNTRPFRNELRQEAPRRWQRTGRPAPAVRRPGSTGTGSMGGNPPVRQQRTPAAAPSAEPRTQDRERQPGIRATPYSSLGGYGTSRDIRTYRERGQASRENLRRNASQPARPVSPAPASQPSRQQSAPPPRSASTPHSARPATRPAPTAVKPPAVRQAPAVRTNPQR